MINFIRKLFCFNHDWEYEQSILDDELVKTCRRCNKVKKQL